MITQTYSVCKYCGVNNSIVTDFKNGVIVCTNCGVVIEDRIIDEENESRNFMDDNGKSTNRTAKVNYTYFDDLTDSVTIISKTDPKLNKHKHKHSNSKTDLLKSIFTLTENKAHSLGLTTSIVESSKDILCDLLRNNLIKGKNKECVIAVVFYKVLHNQNLHWNLRYIAEVLNLEMNSLMKTYSGLKNAFYDYDNNKNRNGMVVTFEGNVKLMLSKMEVEKRVENAIMEIGKIFVENNICDGRNPGTFAGAIVYLVGKLLKVEGISLDKVSKCTSIKEKTIKTAYEEMINRLDLIPQKYKELINNLEKK